MCDIVHLSDDVEFYSTVIKHILNACFVEKVNLISLEITSTNKLLVDICMKHNTL